MLTRTILFLAMISASCVASDGGGSGDDTGSGSNGATCIITATATPNTGSRTVMGEGSAQCTSAAAIHIDTCVQWNPSGTFVDIQCLSSTKSEVAQMTVQNSSSCGIAQGHKFRSRVNVTVDGVAQPEKLSAEVGCE